MAAGNPKQRVGMMYPIWAPLVSHTDGSMPTYGTGIRIMEARTANVAYERNGSADYGDNRIVAEDNGATGMTMSFESTGISNAARIAVLGEEAGSQTMGGQWITDAPSPYGGFGYIEKMLDEDAQTFSYEVWIALKIHFNENSHNSQTREGQTTWGHPTLDGRAIPLDIDGSGKLKFQWHDNFTTLAAAKAKINSMLNYTPPSAQTT
jgi:hypothetical protein